MNKVQTAYAKLQEAAAVMKLAIAEFQQVVDTDTVGLTEWCEHIDDVMMEISEEVNGD